MKARINLVDPGLGNDAKAKSYKMLTHFSPFLFPDLMKTSFQRSGNKKSF